MLAAVTTEVVPKYFPEELDLPLPPDHKTWYTERLCPPLLAQALRSERQAMFIAQLHYWLQKEDVGVYKHGFHWIYNAEWEWREQFPWMSEHTIGRIRRSLERLGYVVSNDFNRNPLDRTKYSTLDYYLIAQETGWNPLGLDLNRSYPHPPEFTKGKRQRGRHKSDSTPRVYLQVGDEPDNLKQPEIVDSARLQNASCNTVTMHSATLPVSSIYKEVPNISKSNLETNLKIGQTEASQKVGSEQIFASEDGTRSSDGQQEVNSRAIEFKSEDQCSAAASLINDEEIELTQQFLASLNAEVERAERYRTEASDQIRRIRIPGLDEEAHEVLWKHQATLEKLNADLNAERIQKAITDNPQYLEDAILAFFENSAKGAKTKESATGFLFNALLKGWKPRQSSRSADAKVQVYTPPKMLESHKPPTLEQVVERKRLMWQNASILRPGVEAWVQQTNGVIMTHDGPVLADTANTPSFSEPEQNELITLNQSSLLVASNHTATVANAPTEPGCHQPPATDNSDEESLSSAAVELPTEPEPTTPPSPIVKQASHSKFQPVEILTKAGEWVAGYFVHSCIAVANLVGIERHFTLFDTLGQTYVYRGQIRPPQNLAGAT